MNLREALGTSSPRRGHRENTRIDVGISIPDTFISAILDALPCEFRHKATGWYLECLIFVTGKFHLFYCRSKETIHLL